MEILHQESRSPIVELKEFDQRWFYNIYDIRKVILYIERCVIIIHKWIFICCNVRSNKCFYFCSVEIASCGSGCLIRYELYKFV